ncbi:MAG: hypothetical protein ABIR71_03490 [Chthoniobacterales bacterium]
MHATRRRWFTAPVLLALLYLISPASAGPPIDGSISYVLRIDQPFMRQSLGQKQDVWKRAVLPKLGFHNRVYTFAPTDLPILKNGRRITGSVYQCLERPEFFYVADSDTGIDFKTDYIFKFGGGGGSLHAPRDRSVVICVNTFSGLTYVESKIGEEKAEWKGNDDFDALAVEH